MYLFVCKSHPVSSGSNHYVDKVGRNDRNLHWYPTSPESFPMNQNASIFVHPFRPFEPHHSGLSTTLHDMIFEKWAWACHMDHLWKVMRLHHYVRTRIYTCIRLGGKAGWWASKSRHEWTKVARSDSKWSIKEIKNTNQKNMVPTNLVHIVVGPERGTWDRAKTKNHWKIKKYSIPASCWDETWLFKKVRRPNWPHWRDLSI